MNMNVRSNKGTAFFMGLSLMALTSCVGTETSFSSYKRDIQAENLAEGESWTATLTPVGAGTASGEAAMKVEGSSFVAQVETSGLSEGTHSQSIRSGTCSEIGELVISLDGDLSSEDEGQDSLPSSDVTGNYLYSETTDLSSIATDLELTGKIVVVYGTSATDTTTPVLCGLIQQGQDELPVPQTGGGQQQQQQQHQGQTEVSMPE